MWGSNVGPPWTRGGLRQAYGQGMPNIDTAVAARHTRLTRAAAIATAYIAVGAATVVIADDRPAPHIRSITEPSQPVATRDFDDEANKVSSMRALRRHIAEQRANRTPRYQNPRGQQDPKPSRAR